MLLIPHSLLGEWGGANLDTPMVGDDYERACAVSSYLGRIPVGRGFALVLGDAPDSTTVLQSVLGFVLLRWGCADSEADMLASARANLGKAKVLEELEHRIEESEHLLIDSAWSGSDFQDSLELRIPPGAYKISTRRHREPTVEFLAHVFQKC